ncbi:hypothetical protein [Qipengyuania spongiae]|uniref:Integrase n=1 Tax=Qipengyuania spongiae TaxID=2909673 RepID=A0ABY5SYD8_9SPHN|nr:hypothetical protein [Qipengyuania spongiae]UVI39553.1 hypothetical protein L1F33_00885 [Qipengyuania spongiae]
MRWQIVPRVLMDGLGHPDESVRKRVYKAMMQMMKIDDAAIKALIRDC